MLCVAWPTTLTQILVADDSMLCVACGSNTRSVFVAASSRLWCCRGSKTKPILPLTEAGPAALEPQERDWDILLTAETHNFPCAVAPYPGSLLLPLFGLTALHTLAANRRPPLFWYLVCQEHWKCFCVKRVPLGRVLDASRNLIAGKWPTSITVLTQVHREHLELAVMSQTHLFILLFVHVHSPSILLVQICIYRLAMLC